MKVSLSLEQSNSYDVSIMVDVLRASTTITVALENFSKIYPVQEVDEAKIIAQKYKAVLAGEREGATLKGFDVGNSPQDIRKLTGDNLVLTTSNGTRILQGIPAQHILIGSFVNASAVANKAMELAEEHIDIVMAGVNGEFTIEDFLGAGEIIYYLKDNELDEMACASLLARDNKLLVNRAVRKSRSAAGLRKLGFHEDIEFCLNRNIYNIVPFYHNGIINSLL